MRLPQRLTREQVSVTTYRGNRGRGPVYDTAVNVAAAVDASNRLVRDASGAEVTASLLLTLDGRHAALVTVGSEVMHAGRQSKVLAVRPMRVRGRTVLVEVDCA